MHTRSRMLLLAVGVGLACASPAPAIWPFRSKPTTPPPAPLFPPTSPASPLTPVPSGDPLQTPAIVPPLATTLPPGVVVPAPPAAPGTGQPPLAALLPGQALADPKPEAPVDVRPAVRAVLDAQVVAWNKGDLEGFMVGYWSSPDLVFFSGKERTQGWQATLDRYRKKYQADGQEMGKLAFTDLDIMPVGPDAAVVRGRWQLERKKDKPGGLFTLLFRKVPAGWKIVHDHTSG